MTLTTNGQHEMRLADLLADGIFLDGDWVESKDQDPRGDVRLIQLADIGDGMFRNRSRRFMAGSRAREMGCTFLEAGDILVARMPEPLGRACLFPGVGQPAVTAVDVCIVRPNPLRASPKWLVRAINSPQFRDSMQAHIRGTTRQRISRRNLGTLPLTVLDLDEQHSMVQQLEQFDRPRASSQEHLSTARQTLERFRKSVLRAACSGELTADWRRRNPASPGSSRKSPHRANFELPESWRWEPLEEIAEIRGGIQKQPKRAPKTHAYPYLRVANVLRGRLDLGEIHRFELFNDELNTYRLMPGDLLVVEGNGSPGEIGRAAMWEGAIDDCVHQNHIIRVRPLDVVPEYLQLYWNSPIAARSIADLAVTTVGLYSLSTKKIASVLIAIPPPMEQSAIVAIVNQLQSVAARVARAIDDATHAVDRSSVALQRAAFAKGRS